MITTATSLEDHIRGDCAGIFEGIDQEGALTGWACRWPTDERHGALRVSLRIEDLLEQSASVELTETSANLPRADLEILGINISCGFLVQGPLLCSLPKWSSGTVIRAYAITTSGYQELSGSPMRLSAERFQDLERICHAGAKVCAGFRKVDGPFVSGWGPANAQLTLRMDNALSVSVSTGADGLFQLAIPVGQCDGRTHHMSLHRSDALERPFLAEAIIVTPFQITPWPSLLEHGQAPFPQHLSPLAQERFRCLHTWLHWADTNRAKLPADLPLLQRLLEGPLEVPPIERSISLPTSEEPRVSIVVPVHNKVGITRRCLAALAYAPTEVPFEVIVVDDGSTDGGLEQLTQEVVGFRHVCHDYGRGFNQACHSGVGMARAEIVVLLNNDTEPCCQWLDELMEVFDRWPDTGIVGAQLIYPNGVLQEAGGIVWGNGEPWNYGRTGNPYAPEVSYTRQVDYVSGAALAIRRSVWNAVGGFSPEFSPAYYEDTDLAMKVSAAGFAVRYAPLSKVVHHEGLSCGTDSDPEASAGVKRFQTLHGPVFQSKWRHAFTGCSEPSFEATEQIKDRGIHGRALFLDHAVPRPDRDAGSHAAIVEMDLIVDLGWKATFLPLNLAWLGRYNENLQRRGIETIHAPFVLSMEDFLRERGETIDLLYITRYSTVRDCLELIRKYAPQAKLLFCNADLHYLRELRQTLALGLEGEARAQALAAVEATKLEEITAMEAVDLTLSYSDVEQVAIEAITLGRAATARCPWVVECLDEPAPLEGRQGLAFLGSYSHPPNRDGVDTFLTTIWPDIHQAYPHLELHLYGSGMSPEDQDSWSRISGVVVHGWIANASDVYQRHRVFIAPLRSGAGLKGKVVAALAHGIPQVISPVAAEGTGLRDGQEVFIAGTADQWLAALKQLLGDDDVWQQCSAAALAYARSQFSRQRGLELMAEAFSRLGLPFRNPTKPGVSGHPRTQG